MRNRPLVFAILGLLISGTSACSDGCENMVIDTVDAPGGLRSAVVFERSCGATTGFSTQVSVLDRGKTVAGAGNALIADDAHGAVQTGAKGELSVRATWLSPTELTLTYDRRSRVFLAETQAGGVSVRHEPISPP